MNVLEGRGVEAPEHGFKEPGEFEYAAMTIPVTEL